MLLLVAIASVLLTSVECFTSQDANNFLDNALSNQFVTEAEYGRLDPMALPDINIDLISKRVWDNKAQLNKGQLHHLSKVKRIGDCSIPHWISANVTFICPLGFNELVVNYTANVSYDNMQLIFYPKTSVRDTLVNIHITASKILKLASLDLLIINDVGKMYVTARMISIGDIEEMVGPPIREAIVENSITNLHHILLGKFKDALAYSISKAPVPFV